MRVGFTIDANIFLYLINKLFCNYGECFGITVKKQKSGVLKSSPKKYAMDFGNKRNRQQLRSAM